MGIDAFGINDIMEQQHVIHPVIKWLCLIVIPAFVGSYGSDYLMTLKHENMKVSVIRILLAMALSFAITFALLDILLEINKMPLIPLISLILGLLGFELINGLSSIENILVLLKKLSDVLSSFTTVIRHLNEARKTHAKPEQKGVGESDAGNIKNTDEGNT